MKNTVNVQLVCYFLTYTLKPIRCPLLILHALNISWLNLYIVFFVRDLALLFVSTKLLLAFLCSTLSSICNFRLQYVCQMQTMTSHNLHHFTSNNNYNYIQEVNQAIKCLLVVWTFIYCISGTGLTRWNFALLMWEGICVLDCHSIQQTGDNYVLCQVTSWHCGILASWTLNTHWSQGFYIFKPFYSLHGRHLEGRERGKTSMQST